VREIIYDDQLYAVHDSLESLEFQKCELDNGQTAINTIYDANSKWYSDKVEPIQASRMCYNGGKMFDTHKHKMRPRLSNYTQECFIIHKGKIRIEIYSEESSMDSLNNIGTIEAKAGDIVILYKGYHGLIVLEDNSIFYEIKNGPFTNVKEDKEYLK